MEITPVNDPTLVTFEPDKDALFAKRVAEEKMSMLTERLNKANEVLGLNNKKAGNVTARNGSTDDVLPFTAIKKYAKVLKGTATGNHIWQMHTNGCWDKQMKEVEALAIAKVTEEMRNAPSGDARVEIDNSSGIVLR